MHESFLSYRRFIYLKVALILCGISIVAYLLHDPIGPRNGGTWLGYTLGGVGAALILWLAWFGIRKRLYSSSKIPLAALLSAHVYLGASLIVIATLHTSYQVGMNIHTLAYVLMLLVIASGFFGVYAYVYYPQAMTENRRGASLNDLMAQITDVDEQCRETAMTLSDEVNTAVFEASRNTRIGGSLLTTLRGEDPACPTEAARRLVTEIADSAKGLDRDAVRRLSALLSRKSELLVRARKDVQFQAILRIWLLLHVPLSVALIAALVAHVFSVFFYW